MSTPKHTPGPWTAETHAGGKPDALWIIDPDGLCVATVHGFVEYPEILAADARLIAAGPDLLAACLAFNAAMPELRMDQQETVKAWNMVARALDKAIGETVCGHPVEGGDAS